jgi:hypothetical protein
MAYQTDEQIAAVLTYVRTAFGNSASAVAPAEITALRSEVGKPPVTVADLKPPIAASPKPAAMPATDQKSPPLPAAAASGKYADLPDEPSFSKWTVLIIGLLLAVVLVPILKRK